MTSELKDRFALVDEVDAPPLWGEARRRAVAPERRLAGPGRVGFGSGGRRIMTAAVAFAVFAVASLFAWELSHPDARPMPPRPVAVEPVDLAAELGPGWNELPTPPEVRNAAATAWTGSQLLVWGGYVFDGSGDKTPSDEGFVFDAASRTWSALPASPLEARARAGSVWTGKELLIWGGWDGGTGLLGDGAAYDPATRTWRRLPAAPLEPKSPLAVWTGEEMIVWGTGIRIPGAAMDGAAFDPSTDTWRTIAEAPTRLTDATPVWTGEEMIVFGAALDGNNHADTPTAVGEAYDPATDTWRELPPSELSPQAHTAAWPGGGEMIAWDYDQASAAYDPRTNTWRGLERVPLRFSECYPQSVSMEGYVFGEFCGQLALYSVAQDGWREITRARLEGWVLEPVAAGSAFLVMGHSLELSDEPGTEFEATMLAYVPPPSSVGPAPEPFVPASEVVGGETRMPIVFPDGSRATLVFPSELGLQELGVQPDVSYVWRADPAPRFPIVFLHGPNASITRFVDEEGPTRLVNTSCGGMEAWRASGNDLQRRFWIRYELPTWTVLVSVRDALESAVEVDCALRIVETDGGFPVVEADGPLGLAAGFGEAQGPQLSFGDAAAEPDVVSQLDATIFLSPDGCVGDPEVSGTYGSVCLAEGDVFASIYGDRDFVSRVIDGLRVEDFTRM